MTKWQRSFSRRVVSACNGVPGKVSAAETLERLLFEFDNYLEALWGGWGTWIMAGRYERVIIHKGSDCDDSILKIRIQILEYIYIYFFFFK